MSTQPPIYGSIGQTQPIPDYTAATVEQNFYQPLQSEPTIIVNQPQVPLASPAVGPKPSRITCPSCRVNITTRVKHSATSNTHCWACGLCVCFCWPCVCLPYCMDSCQNANHYCPNCNAFIGTYQS